MSESAEVTVPVVIEPVESHVDTDTVVEDVSHIVSAPVSSTTSRGSGDEGPTSASEAPVVIIAPTLRVEQLKGNSGLLDSSFCTSEEEGFPLSDDGDGDHSGNNSSVPDYSIKIETLNDPPSEEMQKKSSRW